MIDMPFTPNCSGLLDCALGGHINFSTKARPSEGCSVFLWMDRFVLQDFLYEHDSE